jgi:hypothetical protein
MACHNHRCCFLDCTKLHISSISAASTRTTITDCSLGRRCSSKAVFTCSRCCDFFLACQSQSLC